MNIELSGRNQGKTIKALEDAVINDIDSRMAHHRETKCSHIFLSSRARYAMMEVVITNMFTKDLTMTEALDDEFDDLYEWI